MLACPIDDLYFTGVSGVLRTPTATQTSDRRDHNIVHITVRAVCNLKKLENVVLHFCVNNLRTSKYWLSVFLFAFELQKYAKRILASQKIGGDKV